MITMEIMVVKEKETELLQVLLMGQATVVNKLIYPIVLCKVVPFDHLHAIKENFSLYLVYHVYGPLLILNPDLLILQKNYKLPVLMKKVLKNPLTS